MTPALTGYSLAAQGPSKCKGLAETQIRPEGIPATITVTHFELDITDMEQDQGILKEVGPLRGGVLDDDGSCLPARFTPLPSPTEEWG